MAPTREQRVDSGDRISLILIATTLQWIMQMLISVAIKEYNIFPAVEETQENYNLLVFELLTKVLGIFTVMLADWLLLNCGGGIQQTLPLAQLLFIFLSMIFVGDYGLPVVHFLEASSKVNDDLKHYPLYKKTWSHNVVFQTGMYVLFILVILVEQIHVYRQSNGHSGSPVSSRNGIRREFDPEVSCSMGYSPDLEKLVYAKTPFDSLLDMCGHLYWHLLLYTIVT